MFDENQNQIDVKAFWDITYGLYLVTSFNKKDGRLAGQIANTAIQVASQPLLFAVAINKQNYTNESIRESGYFAIQSLDRDTPMELIGNFGFKSGRTHDKFKDIKYELVKSGVPMVLEHTTNFIELKVRDSVDVGSHLLFIGEVVQSKKLSDKPVLTYAEYHLVKQGKAPKTAPNAIIYEEKLDKNYKGELGGKYRCKICGYVYDPERGDPENDIAAGTPFSSLPEGWVCPICGASKEEFEKI